MIIYLLLTAFNSIIIFLLDIIPTFQTPVWFVQNFPKILETILGFNYYLPIVETIGVVAFLVTFTLQYKVLKIVLEKAGLDMNA